MKKIMINTHRISWRKIEEETFVISWRETEISYIYSINDTGGLLWEMLLKGTSRELLYERAISEYDGDNQEIKKDVDIFLQSLQNEDLLLEL